MERQSSTNEVTTTKRIVKHGNTLGVNLREETDWIGVGYGDLVEVTIKKKERAQDDE